MIKGFGQFFSQGGQGGLRGQHAPLILKMSKARCGGIVIYQNDGGASGDRFYALVKGRQSGKWSFPKGQIHVGESHDDCMLREIYEEIGLRMDTMRRYVVSNPIKLEAQYYRIFIVPWMPQLLIQDSQEVSDAAWIPEAKIDASFLLHCNAAMREYFEKMCSIAVDSKARRKPVPGPAAQGRRAPREGQARFKIRSRDEKRNRSAQTRARGIVLRQLLLDLRS